MQHILPSLAPHLFPDSFNRRGSPRVVLGIPVAYRFGNTIATALTLNLESRRHRHPHDQPARGRRRRRASGSACPAGHREVDVEARVAWSDRRVGHGPAVREGRVADQDAIDEFVDAHFFSNRRA